MLSEEKLTIDIKSATVNPKFQLVGFISLHCALSCAVYCNRPCLCVCVFVCFWVRFIATASGQCLRLLWALFIDLESELVKELDTKTPNSEYTSKSFSVSPNPAKLDSITIFSPSADSSTIQALKPGRILQRLGFIITVKLQIETPGFYQYKWLKWVRPPACMRGPASIRACVITCQVCVILFEKIINFLVYGYQYFVYFHTKTCYIS